MNFYVKGHFKYVLCNAKLTYEINYEIIYFLNSILNVESWLQLCDWWVFIMFVVVIFFKDFHQSHIYNFTCI